MKASDYFEKYGEGIMREAAKGKYDLITDLFREMFSEVETICKTRNAVTNSAAVSAIKEVNQKWNALCKLFEKKYLVSPLKRDAIISNFLRKNPSLEPLFVVQKSTKAFDKEEVEKEFREMDSTTRFLTSMAMLGAYATEKGMN